MKRNSNDSKSTRTRVTARREPATGCMSPQNVGDTSVIGRDFDVLGELKRRKQARNG